MSGFNSLVTTDWLADNLDNPNVRIVDATWHLPNSTRKAQSEYEEGHIAGSVFFDIDEIADLECPLPHMMPSNEKMASRVRSMGIASADHVIVYDNSDFSSAARVWFMFRNFGHDKISILDGGLSKWKAEARPLSSDIQTYPGSHFSAEKNESNIRGKAEITANIDSKFEQVVDARSRGRFLGIAPEPRPESKSGRIPGSLNVPFTELLDEDDGTYLPIDELKECFEDNNVDLSKPIVTSCGSGVTACVLLFALHLIGHKDNALYDGSWSEWGTHPDTPIEK